MRCKIYVDVNIILDLLLNNRLCSKNSVKLLQDLIKENVIFVTNNLNFNTVFYIGAQKNLQYQETKEFLKYIHNDKEQWNIYNLTEFDRNFAFSFMDKNTNSDFEDLQQYIAAKNTGCELIITNDKDFPKLDIPLKRTNPAIEDYTPQK